MRFLTPTERGYLTDPEGHWTFAYLEVTNFDGTWINVGNVAIGARNADFLNTFSYSDNIDANTLSITATLLREVGAYSLSPFRSDSPLNVDDSSAYSPLLDLHRSWRLWGVILPIDTFPSGPSDYREWWTGIVDRIDIQGDPAVITVQGRGMEADIIDARIAFVDNTADPPTAISQDTPKVYASGDLPDVLQAILDDELGVGVVPLTVDGSAPADFINGWNQQSDVGLMDLLAETAGIGAGLLRYKYDSSDVLSFTLFAPNRNPSGPDWTTDGGEYEKLDVGIGLDGVRNYVYVRYFDTTFGQPLVVTSPSASPASATSASIARFKRRGMLIDLAADTRVNDQTTSGNLADAARSDLEFPIIEHTLTGRGFWFAELGDYVQLLANGIQYDQDQFGGITSIQHTFANGELKSVLGMRAKPAGRYRGWLDFGPGTPRAPFTPEMESLSLAFEDDGAFGLLDVVFVFGPLAKSARLELDDDPAFGSVWTTLDFDPTVSGTETRQGFGFPDGTYRNKRWYARVTPYSGPYVSMTGATGVAGPALTANVFAGFQVPTKPQFDTLDASVTAIAAADVLVKTASGALSAERVVTDTPTIETDWSTAGQAKIKIANNAPLPGSPTTTTQAANDNSTKLATTAYVDRQVAEATPDTAVIGAAASVQTIPFFALWNEDAVLKTIPSASTEIDTRLRRPAALQGMTSIRLVGVVTSLTSVAGSVANADYSTDGGASWTSLAIPMTLEATGVVRSAWATLAGGANDDILVRAKTSGGDGTGTAKLSFLALQASATTRTGGGTVITGGGAPAGTIYDDEFVYGSVLDTTGARFASAVAWTKENVDGHYLAADVAGGKLALTTSSHGSYTGVHGGSMPMPAGDWTFETSTDMGVPSPNGDYDLGIGMLLKETSTGKLLLFCYGVEYVPSAGGFRIVVHVRKQTDWGTWTASYGVTILSTTVGLLRISRVGSTLTFQYDQGSGWTTVYSASQTTDFTTAPDRIGLFVNSKYQSGNVTGYFEYWRKTA